MSCLSANAKLIRDNIQTGASVQDEQVILDASIEREELKIDVVLRRDKISIGAGVICSIGKDNSLWASDGALYDGCSDPLFVTE